MVIDMYTMHLRHEYNGRFGEVSRIATSATDEVGAADLGMEIRSSSSCIVLTPICLTRVSIVYTPLLL